MTKKTKNKFLEINHPVFTIPVHLSVVSEEEIQTLITSCADYIKKHITTKGTKEQINVLEYKFTIVKILILNYDELVSNIEQDNPGIEYEADIVNLLYLLITEFYAMVQIDLILLAIIQEENPLPEPELTDVVRRKRKVKPTDVDPFIEDEYTEAGAVKKPKNKADDVLPLKNKEDLNKLEKILRDNIVGQDDAIKQVVDSVKLLITGYSKFTSFLFLGPTGVGKTQISKFIGKAYNNNFIHLNCAEFSQGHEVFRLLGAPPSYIGSGEKSFLAEKSDKGSAWIFLFDEIEKASPKLWNFMLSLLDEGKVSDNQGRELDFTNSIFIMTSNQGVADLKYERLGFGNTSAAYETMKGSLTKSLESQFSPEFLNRIDHIITFNQLNREDIRKIIDLEIKTLPIQGTDSFYDFVLKNAYDPKYNARNIRRFIKKEVMVRLAEAQLAGVRKYAKKYRYEIKDNKFSVIGYRNN